MTESVLRFAQEQVDQGGLVALLTVTETDGSSPASVGQMMAVLPDGRSAGTIGGGRTEFQAAQQARRAMEQGERLFSFSFDHSESGMVCGGGMRGFGNILGNENHLYIFGGGHVGQSLAPLAAAAGFFVTVVEDRAELATSFPSGVRFVHCTGEEYEETLSLGASSFAVICTRGHKSDDDALRFCLSKSPRYTGMIGSRKKVGTLFDRLRQEGYDEARLAGIYAPIGLDIASAIPAEIAVSIMAEMLLVKNGGCLRHKRDTKG